MKKINGQIIKCSSSKTAVLEIVITRVDPLYKKRIAQRKTYLVHNSLDAQPGDRVAVIETRPISKNKSWKITEILNSKKTEKKAEKSEVIEKNAAKKTQRKVKK